MAESPIQVLVTPRESSGDAPLQSTRIDTAHSPTGSHAHPPAPETPSLTAAAQEPDDLDEPAAPDPRVLAAIAGVVSTDESSALQSQADELGEQLRERQQDLDRRESMLHSQLARQEQNLRASRLWVQERELTLRSQESEMQDRAAGIAQKASELETRGIAIEESLQSLRRSLEHRKQELDEREASIVAREEAHLSLAATSAVALASLDGGSAAGEMLREERRRLEQDHARRLAQLEEARQEFESRRSEHDARHAAAMEQVRQQAEQLDAQRAEWESKHSGQKAANDTLARREAELQARLARVNQQEAKLAQIQADIERGAQQRETERSLAENTRHDRQAREDEQRRARDREQRDRQQRLDQQDADLAAREQALEGLQGEVSKVHREALEMRLVVEQLWAQLTGRATPQQLSEGLQEVRQQVADHFRAREQILAEQRSEIERLAARLESQQARLREQHTAQQDWFLARRSELADLADALAQKELDLDEELESRARRRKPLHSRA